MSWPTRGKAPAAIEGGGSGGGVSGTIYNVASGATQVLTKPGAAAAAYYEDTVTLRLLGATGGYSNADHIVDGVLPPIRQAIGSELVLPRYTTDSGASYHLVGLQPGDSIGEWAYTDLPLASAVPGVIASATGLISDRSVLVQSNGTRWRYASGREILRFLTVPQTPHSQTTENNTGRVGSNIVIPAGFLQPGDILEFWYAEDKTNSNGTGSLSIRLGDQGDTTDAPLVNIATAPNAAASRSYAFTGQFRVESATQIRQLGGSTFLWAGTAAGQAPSPVTVDSMNALPVQIAFRNWLVSGLDTISATEFRVIHHTP